MIFLNFEAMRQCEKCMTASKQSNKRYALSDHEVLDNEVLMMIIVDCATEVLRHFKAVNCFDSHGRCSVCREPFVSPLRIVKNPPSRTILSENNSLEESERGKPTETT